MELSGIRTYGITWKYSIPFQGGAEGIWWNFHSIPENGMEIPHKMIPCMVFLDSMEYST